MRVAQAVHPCYLCKLGDKPGAHRAGHAANATGSIAKWDVELVEFELHFIPLHAVHR
jgi:hypothetical protein